MADVTWTISGKLAVSIAESNDLTETLTVTADLVNAEVDIEGSSVASGGFSSWGTTRTDSQGAFTLTARKPNAARRIRARVRFRDDTLKVTAPSPASDWYDFHASAGKLDPPTVVIPPYTISRDGCPRNDYTRAATWYLCKTVIDTLTARDPWFAFKNKVTIIYPGKALGGAYANGVTREVVINDGPTGIFKDQWTIGTLLHEFMHIWNYDHNHGASPWFGAVVTDCTTHSFQEMPAIAFHEGFASWAKDELLHHVWGFSRLPPSTRLALVGNKHVSGDGTGARVLAPLDTLRMVERNEGGVQKALALLTTPDIYTWTFGTEASPATATAALSIPLPRFCPRAPRIDFWDVLSVFRADADAGWPTNWEAQQSSGLVRFYDRVSDILPDFDAETKAMYLALLDRKSIVQPQDRCGLTREVRPLQP